MTKTNCMRERRSLILGMQGHGMIPYLNIPLEAICRISIFCFFCKTKKFCNKKIPTVKNGLLIFIAKP